MVSIGKYKDKLVLHPTNTDEIKDCEDLYEVLDYHLCNGLDLISADEIDQLSEAPILSYDLQLDDDGSWRVPVNAELYAYVDYMLYDPVEQLKKGNDVTFILL
jgi:hypothetical protein